MLLGVGGLEIGLVVEPGPGVLLGVAPGGHGLATVADVPAGVDVVVPAEVEVEPMPLLVDEVVLVDGIPVDERVLVEGVAVVVVVVPVPVLDPRLPLLEGVHGTVVTVVPDWP